VTTPDVEADEQPDSPRDAFLQGIFDLEKTFGLPLTNNEPRMQDGRQLHDVGDFTAAVETLVNETLLVEKTQALSALTDTVAKVQTLADAHRADASTNGPGAPAGFVAVSDLDALVGTRAPARSLHDDDLSASRS
jgi:hypothetical protein